MPDSQERLEAITPQVRLEAVTPQERLEAVKPVGSWSSGNYVCSVDFLDGLPIPIVPRV